MKIFVYSILATAVISFALPKQLSAQINEDTKVGVQTVSQARQDVFETAKAVQKNESDAEVCESSETDISSSPKKDEDDTNDENYIADEEDNSQSEEFSVDSSSDVFRKKNLLILTSVKEAEMLYKEAVRSYEKGNSKKAEELYNNSLKKLCSANMNPEMYYGMKDDFENIFGKLDRILKESTYNNNNAGKKYAIRIEPDNELVKKFLKQYTEGNSKEQINKALQRSGKYRDMILETLKEYDLPEELVYLPIVESLYNINDLSSAGALGLWQIIPVRAEDLNLKMNYWIDERKDPEKSTRAAAMYLKELFIMFDDWHLALAAYNRGENGLARDLRFSNATNIEQISKRKAVPKETEYYVPQFIVCTMLGSNPEKYGFKVNYEKPLKYDTVIIDKIIDLKVVAKCANTSLSTIRDLNPAIKAWCTPYNYPGFELHLPPGAKETFVKNIALEKDLNPSQGFIKYKVKKGDCLSKIAGKFKTTVSAIKEDNKIRDVKALRISQILVIRPGRKYIGE